MRFSEGQSSRQTRRHLPRDQNYNCGGRTLTAGDQVLIKMASQDEKVIDNQDYITQLTTLIVIVNRFLILLHLLILLSIIL